MFGLWPKLTTSKVSHVTFFEQLFGSLTTMVCHNFLVLCPTCDRFIFVLNFVTSVDWILLATFFMPATICRRLDVANYHTNETCPRLFSNDNDIVQASVPSGQTHTRNTNLTSPHLPKPNCAAGSKPPSPLALRPRLDSENSPPCQLISHNSSLPFQPPSLALVHPLPPHLAVVRCHAGRRFIRGPNGLNRLVPHRASTKWAPRATTSTEDEDDGGGSDEVGQSFFWIWAHLLVLLLLWI